MHPLPEEYEDREYCDANWIPYRPPKKIFYESVVETMIVELLDREYDEEKKEAANVRL